MFGPCLHHVAHKGDVEMYQVIIEKMGVVNPKDKKSGTTPLHIAAMRGNVDMVEFLIAKIEDFRISDSVLESHIHLRDEGHTTPFTLAVKNNHVDIVKMFVEKVNNANPEFNSKCSILQIPLLHYKIDYKYLD